MKYRVLIVAGGGGSGYYGNAGGGGGGGMVEITGSTYTSGSYPIIVGAGGIGQYPSDRNGTNGGDSSFANNVAIGGGSGGGGKLNGTGAYVVNGGSGGSGGGSGYDGVKYGTMGVKNQGNTIDGLGYGNNGGGGVGSAWGGGAGSAASGASGGLGRSNDISGTSKLYAAGGNSTGANSTTKGTINTGNGSPVAGGGGGSGIVIIRYTASKQLATGGIITQIGGDYIHTFTSNGTFEIELIPIGNMKINISDVWKDMSNMKINIGGVWKPAKKGFVNISDIWKEFYTLNTNIIARVLVVGGGGGGGTSFFNPGGYSSYGAGGGGGQVKYTTGIEVTSSITIVVGSGGSSDVNGNQSSFGNIVSSSGIKGGPFTGGNSGSGKVGGSEYRKSTGYGNSGGGGGDSANGGNGTTNNGGYGGAGTSNDISGSSYIYSIGGNGATGTNALGGSGNYGSGGGCQAAGKNGIVIVRYTSSTQKATGGTVTTSGGDYIHTFTSSGTFTIS